MPALFSYIYLNEITISAWCLAVVVSLEKKGSSANIMDGYRGVHVLNFCSQWYAQCLNDRLGILVTRSTPLPSQSRAQREYVFAAIAAKEANVAPSQEQPQGQL